MAAIHKTVRAYLQTALINAGVASGNVYNARIIPVFDNPSANIFTENDALDAGSRGYSPQTPTRGFDLVLIARVEQTDDNNAIDDLDDLEEAMLNVIENDPTLGQNVLNTELDSTSTEYIPSGEKTVVRIEMLFKTEYRKTL